MTEHSKIEPPKFPLKILRWFCDLNLLEDVEGDLQELYHERMKENPFTAKLDRPEKTLAAVARKKYDRKNKPITQKTYLENILFKEDLFSYYSSFQSVEL